MQCSNSFRNARRLSYNFIQQYTTMNTSSSIHMKIKDIDSCFTCDNHDNIHKRTDFCCVVNTVKDGIWHLVEAVQMLAYSNS